MGAPTRARYLRRKNATTAWGVGLLFAIVFTAGMSLWLGEFLTSGRHVNPAQVVVNLIKGDSTFAVPRIWGFVIVVLFLVGQLLLVLWVRSKMTRPAWVDVAATHMGSSKELQVFSEKAARQKAVQLNVISKDKKAVKKEFKGIPNADGSPKTVPNCSVGQFMGVLVSGGTRLYASYEDVGLIFAGPRTGKTSSYSIPLVLNAPGAVVATENKRGLHDHTRGIREQVGRVFVFDPQKIVGEKSTWWWNPLSTITNGSEANSLAEHFASGSRSPQAGPPDAFFHPRAITLLKALLLAAALGGYCLRDVQRWLANPDTEESEPYVALKASTFPEVLNEFSGVLAADSGEKTGVFSTAQTMTACLADQEMAAWVNPVLDASGHDSRVHFDPDLFITGSNTLYSLSRDTAGSAAPLVTALTVAVCEAGQRLAKVSAQGRLAKPLSVILDEAANVCRWKDLPQLYSYFGSQGILLVTILQSYPQGAGVWGELGMDALMSASNWKIYAGGNVPGKLLTSLVDSIGSYYYTTPGTPASKGSPRGIAQEHEAKIFDAAELQALPKGRAILTSTGQRAALLRTVPWMAGPYKDGVEASVKKFDPQGEETLKKARQEILAQRKDPDRVGVPV